MRKLLALALLTLVVGGWMTRKHLVAFDGGDPPPQCTPKTCPPLPH